MSKAILEFNLSDPEEREEFDKAVKASDYLWALQAFAQELRKDYKYSQDTEINKHADRYRQLLFRILDDYNVEI